MKPVLFIFSLIFLSSSSIGQLIKKYSISNSGCAAYMFCNPGEFEISYSPDSSVVYTAECKSDSLHYGIICVKMKAGVADSEDAEQILISYLDFLKRQLSVTSSAGYGKGHALTSNSAARGVIDYWKDKDGNDWKIKGWTDGKFMSVLYVYADGAMNEPAKVNVFLDGFRFPEK